MDFSRLISDLHTLEALKSTIINILVYAMLIFVFRFLIELAINRFERRFLKAHIGQTNRTQQRIKTLIGVANNLTISLLIVLSFYSILKNFISTAPLLTSAGIAGLAISFGLQSIIKDIFTGIFFLAQDQFGVGDVVVINTINGVIIEITLRTVTIRDFSGNVTTFSNGSITQVTNMSKGTSLFDMTFTIPDTFKVDEIISMLERAGEMVEKDKILKRFMIGKTEILGLETLGGGNMGIRINIKTIPGRQFEIGRSYRYNLKKLQEEHELKSQ